MSDTLSTIPAAAESAVGAHPELDGLGRYDFGWADSDVAGAAAKRGLSEDVVRNISALKNEPEWMLAIRLKGLRLFGKKPMPTWGSDLGRSSRPRAPAPLFAID